MNDNPSLLTLIQFIMSARDTSDCVPANQQEETVPVPTKEKIPGLVVDTLSQQLQKYIDRIEALEEEKAEIANSIKEALQEAKGDGLDIKALKELLKLRKMEQVDRQEQQSTLHQYMQALGMHSN